MQRSLKVSIGLMALLLCTCLAPAALADGLFDAASWQQESKSGCAAIDQPVLLPSVQPAEIFLFALPAKAFGANAQLVELVVRDAGVAVVRERLSFTGSNAQDEFVVLEALAETPDLRRQLSDWLRFPAERFSVEVTVGGRAISRMSLVDFAAESGDVRGLSILPTAASREILETRRGAEKFQVCGDNICAGGTFPNGEDCETCPQDCGSCIGVCGNNFCGINEDCNSCPADCGACPSCPTYLGQESRTELLSVVTLNWSCLQDIYYPFDSKYFQRNQLNYKSYDVDRTRECNGSITETVVPGSTTYFSTYCFKRTYLSCFGGFAWPGCVY